MKASEIEPPQWWKRIDELITSVAGLKETFNGSFNFYHTWKINLTTPPEELEARIKQRKELIACVQAKHNEKLDRNAGHETTIKKLDKSIDELTSHIAFLEIEIAGRSEHIAQLKQEIKKTKEQYDELIGENEEKATQLMMVFYGLLEDYNRVVAEREVFRKNLEDYYQALTEYNADIRVDWDKLEKDICKKNDKKSQAISE